MSGNLFTFILKDLKLISFSKAHQMWILNIILYFYREDVMFILYKTDIIQVLPGPLHKSETFWFCVRNPGDARILKLLHLGLIIRCLWRSNTLTWCTAYTFLSACYPQEFEPTHLCQLLCQMYGTASGR
jgi:hypothetical protein